MCVMKTSLYLISDRSSLGEASFKVIPSLAATTPNFNAIEGEDRTKNQMLQDRFLLTVHVVDNSSCALNASSLVGQLQTTRL